MRLLPLLLLSFLPLSACGGGGGGGGSEPPVEPNDAPVITPPLGLGGGPVRFTRTLPVQGADTLRFTATDPNGDPLLWQASMSAPNQAATGLTFTTPQSGSVFEVQIAAVTAPAAATLNLLVEDGKGGAAAVDLLVIRSGPPSITAVEPTSAFVSATQEVEITGSSLSLGGTAASNATFGGVTATDTMIEGETRLTCLTPVPGVLGANEVRVVNQYGSSSLPTSAFTMYSHPIDLFDADAALDGGNGAQLHAANDGPSLQCVWVEGGALQHRTSADAGATWSPTQPLSGGEVVSAPQVAVAGDVVTVVWIGDGSAIWTRNSSDGGATFQTAVQLNPAVASAPTAQPQLAISGARRYCVWLQGSPGLGQQRVRAAASDDGGATWMPERLVSDVGSNQFGPALAANGDAAWIGYVDSPIATGAGVYTSRTDNGGLTWSQGVRRSIESGATGSVRTCNDGERAYLVWLRAGTLEYTVSTNSGLGWSQPALELQGTTLGVNSDPVVACEGERLFCAHVFGGNQLAVTRVGGAGALPESAQVSAVVETTGRPTLAVRGNYAFVAWRGGAVTGGTGPARIRYATSVDVGLTWTPASGLGDGAAAQELPHLLLDGARVWLGWLDYRGATPALFQNRTEQ